MRYISFRLIISITIFLVVFTVSFFALYLFNSQMSKEIYDHAKEDIHSGISIMQGHFIHTVSQHGGKALHPFLDDLKRNSQFSRIYLFNKNDSLVYHSDSVPPAKSETSFYKINDLNKDVSIENLETETNPDMRAYIRLENTRECHQCHDPSVKYLGLLVLDIPMEKTHKNIELMRSFSITYSLLIVLIVFLSAFFVHYRFVKRSLSKFHHSIEIINRGNLDERISIPGSRELGELGKSFNEMVDTFQKTQKELQRYNQKELESKYRLATIGEMTARLAHEIRNPITGIANAAEILVNQDSDEHNKPVLEEIRRQAERVNLAISNMLRFSRTTEISKEKGNINETVSALVFFIKNQTHQKKIEFKKILRENIPDFAFDREKIENVLLNLGLNAIQAIPEEGEVTFRTTYDKENKQVIISVEDTGMGIAENDIENIFNPFFTTRTEGTGLGLAIAKEIIEKHNGKIWVESIKQKGSKFFISLPAEE